MGLKNGERLVLAVDAVTSLGCIVTISTVYGPGTNSSLHRCFSCPLHIRSYLYTSAVAALVAAYLLAVESKEGSITTWSCLFLSCNSVVAVAAVATARPGIAQLRAVDFQAGGKRSERVKMNDNPSEIITMMTKGHFR